MTKTFFIYARHSRLIATMHSARLAEGVAIPYQVMVAVGDGGGQIEETQRRESRPPTT